eukprot:2367037-Rhodomonas_salina.1
MTVVLPWLQYCNDYSTTMKYYHDYSTAMTTYNHIWDDTPQETPSPPSSLTPDAPPPPPPPSPSPSPSLPPPHGSSAGSPHPRVRYFRSCFP